MSHRRTPSPRRRASLPRCRCGKAIYLTRSHAGSDSDRFRMSIYRCGFGEIHLTSTPRRGPMPVSLHKRKPAVPILTACPACPQIGPDFADNPHGCAHPVHWLDRDPNLPYFPQVRVVLTGKPSPWLAARVDIPDALIHADVDVSTVAAFETDLIASQDHADTLMCARRWVTVT